MWGMSNPAIVADDAASPTSPPVPEEITAPTPPAAPSSGTPDLSPGPLTFVPAADPVLALIERAARDETVNVEKMQQLFALRERLEAQRASLIFAEAFAELGPDLPIIDRRGRIVVFSKADREKAGGVPEGARPIQQTPYATLDDILEALRAPLAAHGFSLRFEHETTQDNRLVTTAVLRHRGGHQERATTPPLQHDSTGSKNPVQAIGSALSYGRRYSLMAVLPIVSHAPQDADDDGKAAGDAPIDVDQISFIEQQLRDTESDVEKFLVTIGASAVSAMTLAQFKRGVALLSEKKRRAAKAKP